MSLNLVTNGQGDNLAIALDRLARDPEIPTDRIVTLYELMERRERTLLQRIFNQSMNDLQKNMHQIMQDKPNSVFNSRYASEEQIDREARPTYTKYGFTIRYGTRAPEVKGNVCVVCIISHDCGYFEEHSMEGPPLPSNRGATVLQGVVGAVTYLKRALIRMVLNLVTYDNPDDNDGNALGDRPGHGSPAHTPVPTNGKPPSQTINSPTDEEYWGEFVDKFEAAMGRIADSDQAKLLLEGRTAVIGITGVPTGELRRRYMQLRADTEKKWLAPVTPPVTHTNTEETTKPLNIPTTSPTGNQPPVDSGIEGL